MSKKTLLLALVLPAAAALAGSVDSNVGAALFSDTFSGATITQSDGGIAALNLGIFVDATAISEAGAASNTAYNFSITPVSAVFASTMAHTASTSRGAQSDSTIDFFANDPLFYDFTGAYATSIAQGGVIGYYTATLNFDADDNGSFETSIFSIAVDVLTGGAASIPNAAGLIGPGNYRYSYVVGLTDLAGVASGEGSATLTLTVPLPAGVWAGVALIGALGSTRLRRRAN